MSKKYINFETEDDSISKYFRDVRKSIILTQEEEIALAKRIKSGDLKAVDELAEANLKFVISIAKEYQGQGLPLSDLISEGNYGLVHAAHKFDHEMGFRFISYAVWWIKHSIMKSLNENARMVRLPANVIQKISNLKKEIEKFEAQNERHPVYGEILDENNQAMQFYHHPKCVSLNDVINDDGDELIEVIGVEDEEDRLLIDERVKNELQSTLSILSDRERDIVECYYGVGRDCEPMTLEAIGDKYQLTKERIRQIKKKSLRKVRNNSYKLFDAING